MAFARALPETAAELHATDPAAYPGRVGAEWLCGKHSATHRRVVLGRFAPGPGEGKVSRIIVPVFLAPGEDPSDMMASPSCRSLVAVLQGLRAHDERVIERMALPTTTGRGQATSVVALDPVREEADDGDHVQEEGAEDGTEETAAGSASGEGEETAQPAAQAGTDNDTADKEQAGAGAPLLRFFLPRNAGDVAMFLRTRVLHPDSEIWLTGYNALRHWVREHRSAEVPLDASVELGEDRITYALCAWVSEQRRAFRLGTLKPGGPIS
ncbi:helicase associated domain-containing protein [Streptomyces pratensis]|uniref:helicase associated domain-containing protein n=1 Tax=Streptomyces pratensis TaxID=1169025 RepID=UPI001EE408FC|nr:helicase associated domain-containing protein [Streptomyces pratensis]